MSPPDAPLSPPSIAPRPARAWTIVAACAVANMLAWSVRATFALFYVALVEHFAWPRGVGALGYSLSWLLVLAFGPLAGRLHDRLGAPSTAPRTWGGCSPTRRPAWGSACGSRS